MHPPAIDVGQGDDATVYLSIEVGAASLVFGFSPSELRDVGQTLLTLSAQPSDLSSPRN